MRFATVVSSIFAAFVLFSTGQAHAVCCGLTCCSIDAACRHTGDTNPLNPCEECRPSGPGGQFDWSPITGCTFDGGPPVVDSGVPMTDAGSTGTDAGSTGTDAGSSGTDAGTPPTMDSGAPGTDAGRTTPPPASGCSCTAAGRGPGETGGVVLSMLALGLVVARRRR